MTESERDSSNSQFRSRGISKYLFQHKSTLQIVIKNSLWLGLAQGFLGIFNFLLAIYLSHKFGATGYGRFALGLSFAFLFATLFDFGLSTVLTREFTRDEESNSVFGHVLGLKIAIGGASFLILMAASIFVVHSRTARMLALILALYIFLTEIANMYYGVYRARQRMEWEGIFRLIQVFLLAGIVVASVIVHPSTFAIAWAFAISAAINLVIVVFVASRSHAITPGTKRWFDKKTWRFYFVTGWYLALARGVGDIINYLDSVLLGAFGQISQVGHYNAAGKVNAMLVFPISLAATAMFPALISALKSSEEKFNHLWFVWARLSVWAAVFVVFITWIMADLFIKFLYPASFHPAVLSLRILVISSGFLYVHMTYLQVLMIFDKQRSLFRGIALAAVLNVLINLVVIPRWGLYAASATTSLAHIVILICFVFSSRRMPVRLPSKKLVPVLARSLVAAGVMTAVIVLLRREHLVSLLPGTAIGILSYAACLTGLEYGAKRFAKSHPVVS
ncbi:MAG: flippase [Actinomycetota bacterium]